MAKFFSAPIPLNTADVVNIGQGLIDIYRDGQLAAAGQPGLTTLVVSGKPHASFSPNAFVTSLADGCVMYVNNVFQGVFDRGQNFEWDASQGDVVLATKGGTGAYALDGGTERPVELASLAGAARQFFWYAFRQPNHRHYIQAAAMESTVRVYGPNPVLNPDCRCDETPIQEVTLQPFEVFEFTTSVDAEYYALATQPVMLTTTNNNGGTDQRVVLPLSTRLFGHTVASTGGGIFVSALFANTAVTVFMADGTIFTGTASPGSPLNLHALGFESHYAASGWFIAEGSGPIALFMGADAAGNNAVTGVPVEMASQVAGMPIGLNGAHGATDSVSWVSEFEGQIKVFQPDHTLVATVPLIRLGTVNSPAVSANDQRFPAAARLSDHLSTATNLQRGSYAVSNVPMFQVANFNEGNNSRADHDETACYGITPIIIAAEIREDANGLLRRRDIDAAGAETWTVC